MLAIRIQRFRGCGTNRPPDPAPLAFAARPLTLAHECTARGIGHGVERESGGAGFP